MPFKLKKILEIEITDKALEMIRKKVENGDYSDFDDLLQDLEKLLHVFPRADRIKAFGIIGIVVVAVAFIFKFL